MAIDYTNSFVDVNEELRRRQMPKYRDQACRAVFAVFGVPLASLSKETTKDTKRITKNTKKEESKDQKRRGFQDLRGLTKALEAPLRK